MDVVLEPLLYVIPQDASQRNIQRLPSVCEGREGREPAFPMEF